MQNKKKLLGWLVVLLCVAMLSMLLVTGCGKKNKTDTDTQPSDIATEMTDGTVDVTEGIPGEETTESTLSTEETVGETTAEEDEGTTNSGGINTNGNYTGATIEMILGLEDEEDEEDDKSTKPTESKPAATEPAATQPAATEPAATQPAATQPAATEPAATQPAATQPAATEPAATEPAATQPAATQPAATEPEADQPDDEPWEDNTDSATEPVATKPVETEPATEPASDSVEDPGSESNAYVEFVTQTPDEIDTVKIPGKKVMHYYLYDAVNSQLVIEDKNAYVIYNGETYKAVDGVVSLELLSDEASDEPIHVEIGNKASKQKAFTMKFEYPQGRSENPLVVEDISQVSLTLDSGDVDGYYVHYTAMQDGVLSLSMDAGTVNCDLIVTRNWTDEDGKEQTTVVKLSESDGDAVVLEAEIGDLIVIQILPGADAGNGEITLTGEYQATSGTEEAPTWLELPEDTMIIPADTTIYYLVNVQDAIMTLTGEGIDALSLDHNGKTYTADEGTITLEPVNVEGEEYCSFAVTNSGSKAVTCSVVFTYHVGDYRNPATMALDVNTAEVKAGSQGYWYQWTATVDGELTITMDDANADGWYYCINGGDAYASTDAEPVSSQTLTVQEGDEISIVVNTADAVEGTVSMTASFQAGSGTKDNPYLLIGTLETDLTVKAGKTLYFQCRTLKMQMTLTGENVEVIHGENTFQEENGVVSFIVTEGDQYNPPIFGVTNLSDEDTSYHILFTYVLGSDENPETLTMGENSVTLEADSDGYVYQFVATEMGKLTITMHTEQNTSGWIYAINNITTGIYGDYHYCSETDPVVTESVNVRAGQKIKVIVGTYEPGSIAPAGTIYFEATFTPRNPRPTEPTEPEVTEATEPEVTEATEPEVTEATEPEVTEATEPEVTEATEPEVTEATEPEVTEATEPEVIAVAEPEETEATEPEVTEATEPEVTEATEPEATEATEPEETEATEPEETEATEPEVTEVTKPEVTEVTEPEVTEATEPEETEPEE